MYVWVVYKTTCLANGKIYIGQHKTKIIEDGYLGSGKLIRRAIKKYGIDEFVREILVECSCKEDANKEEEFWIDSLNSTNPEIGYNITKYAWGGQPITEEARQKISLALKGKPKSEDFKKSISKPKSTRTKEHSKKISEMNKGKKWYCNPQTGESKQFRDDETIPEGWVRGRGKMKKREPRTFSDEALANIRNANQSEEKRSNISNSLKGHEVSEETRSKISNTLKGNNDEEIGN